MVPYEVDGVKLDKLKLYILTYLTRELVEEIVNPPEVKISEHVDPYGELIGVQVRYAILGQEMERVECRWPADWWQAFKARWFPEWAKARWPVREEVRQLVARELYPKVKLPDREPHIALEVR